jgi:hypothetical protein
MNNERSSEAVKTTDEFAVIVKILSDFFHDITTCVAAKKVPNYTLNEDLKNWNFSDNKFLPTIKNFFLLKARSTGFLKNSGTPLHCESLKKFLKQKGETEQFDSYILSSRY